MLHVQSAWFGKRGIDGLLGNFVEHHAAVALGIAANGFLQMPSYGFTLPIQVSCEKDVVGRLRELLQFADDFFLAGQNLVARRPVLLGVDAHAGDELFFSLARLVGDLLGGTQFAGLGGGRSTGLYIDSFPVATNR